MRNSTLRWLSFAAICITVMSPTLGFAGERSSKSDFDSHINTLLAVDREGKGNKAATQAWQELTRSADAEQLPSILTALDGAGPLAANWLRSAVDAIAERQIRRDAPLPLAQLEQFLNETGHDPRARRLAYEWIARGDASASDRLVPKMLDDPSLELRRDAVARVLATAQKADDEKNIELALASYRKALVAARDLDQVKTVTEALKKAGHPVDLAEHYGFVQNWHLVGPFDNQQGKGFAVAYPPETSVDLAANYETPQGAVRWIAHHTDDEYGFVDLNKAIGKHMGVAGYAAVEFESAAPRKIELRLGTECANKIWLNGKLLEAAEVYHANGTMDQYIGAGELRAGRNLILVKLCQNEQTETWAQDWKFQLRVCDSSGKAVLAANRPKPGIAQAGINKTSEEARDAAK